MLRCIRLIMLHRTEADRAKTRREREVAFCFSKNKKRCSSSGYRCALALLNKPKRRSSEKRNTAPGASQQHLKLAMVWPPQAKCRPGLSSQCCQCRFCDLVCHALAHVLVLLRETIDVHASRIQVTGQTKTRAIELSDDVLCAMVVDGDKISSPQQWKCRHVLAESFHDGLDFCQELVLGLGELWGIRRVDGRHSLTADTSHILVMFDPVKLRSDHHEACLTLFDAGQEPLIHHLATCLLATLVVLACANGLPLARLVCAATDTKLHELGDCVFFHVAVIRLRQDEYIVVCCRLLPVAGTILSGLELHDPNALASRASVLLYDARLEGDGLRETSLHVLGAVVTKGVRQAKIHLLDAAQSILGAHALHDRRLGPHRLARCNSHHGIVELLLVATHTFDLARIYSHDHTIELFQGLEENIMVVLSIVYGLARHSAVDEPPM